MSSRKKGKKTKGQTINLTEFLAPGGVPTVPLKSTNWADDVEDEHDSGYMSRSNKEPVVLPTAPRAARGPGVDEENIPTNPPYVAYISNLPYDVIESDLHEFFDGMEVLNIRLPKDSNKSRGYGYVDFGDRQSLIDALSMSNTTIKTRRVRIDVSNSSNDERRGGRMGMGRDNRREGYDDPERTAGDWRSRPRDENSGGNDDRFRSRGFDSRDRREDRETSENDNKPGGWREGERSTPAFSDRRGYRDDERRGGFKDEERSAFGERRGGFRDDGPRRGFRDDDRRNFRDENRDRDYSRERNTSGAWRSEGPPRSTEPREPRESREPREQREPREPREPREAREPREPAPSQEPRTRPKLNLQPRSKPVETPVVEEPNEESAKEIEPEEKNEEKESAPAPTPVPAANIFGAAKPVDTAAREREIEERLAKASAEKPKAEEAETKAAWTRRNGEGRVDRDKEKPRPTWRSEEDRGRQMDRRQDSRKVTSGRSEEQRGDSRGDSKGPPTTRSGPGSFRGDKPSNEPRRPSDKDRRSKDREDDVAAMPKATDQEAPNFAASNKFSMLHADEDSDNVDD